MKKFNLFLIIICVITISLVIYFKIFNNTNYLCVKKFGIITRSKWNFNTAIDTVATFSYQNELKMVLKNIIIHHSAFSGNFGVKNIRVYQLHKGFTDIAYHFIIGKDGKIYEGRKINFMGAHAGETIEANNLADSIRNRSVKKNMIDALKLDPDYGSIGVCLDGNFEEEQPTECQIKSLKELVIYLMEKYNITKEDVILHSEVRELLILRRSLHTNKDETNCPGKYGVIAIKEMLKLIK